MKNRLQFRHSDQLFATREEVIKYLQNQMIFEPGKQALFAEPLVFKYGEDESNPKIILAIGSYGNGENNNKNKYFIIDTTSIENDIEEIKNNIDDKFTELSKILDEIEKLKAKDTEITTVLGEVGAALQFEINRAKEAENVNATNIASNTKLIEDEKTRSIEKDEEHDLKIKENADAINAEKDRAESIEKSITIYPKDSTTIAFTKEQNDTGTTISGSLKVSQLKGQQLKVISSNGGDTEGLYFNVGLNYDTNTGAISLLVNDEIVNTYYLPLEQFLDSELTHYDPETKKIILVFREQGKDLKYVEIPIGDLVDTYSAGDGLKLSENTFSVKINEAASEKYISVSEDGIVLSGIKNEIDSSIAIEKDRAELAEKALSDKIDSEINRATNSETSLLQKINDEVSRAEKAEETLQSNLDKEIIRADNAEKLLQTNIDNVESSLTKRLDANVLNINELNTKIQTEVDRATSAESVLTLSVTEIKESLAKEIERAQGSEAQITTNYIAADAETLRASKEYTDSKITEETNRAQLVEKEIKDIIGSEFNTSNTITSQLTKEVTERKDADAALKIDIAAISGNSATKVALEQEIDNRTLKDTELENKINSNISAISDLKNSVRTYTIKKIIPGDTGTTASYELVDDKGSRCGEVIDIPLDQILEQAEYDSEAKKLILTFRVGTGTTKTEIDVADLIDEYVPGNGINIDGNTISIKRDSSSEGFLSLSNAGLKLSGVQTAIDSSVTIERQRAESAEQVLTSNIQEVKQKVDLAATQEQLNAEVERAKAAETIGVDNTNKTVEVIVTPKDGGGNILSTDIKTSAYQYNMPTSGDSYYSLLGKLPDGTLFAMNTTNAMRHKLLGNDHYTDLETVINTLRGDIDNVSAEIEDTKLIANSAVTVANNAINIANSALTVANSALTIAQENKTALDNLTQNLETIVKQYVEEALTDSGITNEITNMVKQNIISNTVFKQKVSGDTDVEVIVDEGKTVTIGLGDNCTIASISYTE